MKTMRIDIINPKAVKQLQDLADVNLIAIHDKPQTMFVTVLKKLRSDHNVAPSLDEITEEVELVRQERYAKQR